MVWGKLKSNRIFFVTSLLLVSCEERFCNDFYIFLRSIMEKMPFVGGVLRADDIRPYNIAGDLP